MLKNRIIGIFLLLLLLASCRQKEEVICYGTPTNDLMKLLDEEGYQLRIYPSVHEALQKAPKQAGVLLLSKSYPREGVKLDEADQKIIKEKSLRVFMEFPQCVGTTEWVTTDTLELERIVVCDSLNSLLPSMSLLSFQRCIMKQTPNPVANPLLVAAKVAGFNEAVYRSR